MAEYALPPRCAKCKRLIAYNDKGEDLPCKCEARKSKSR
jgi:hypothetical protein